VEGPSPPHPSPHLGIQHAPSLLLQATGKLAEGDNRNAAKNCHSDGFCSSWALRSACRGLVGSASCCTRAGGGIATRDGMWGWDCPLSNSKRLFNRLSYTIKPYGSPSPSNGSSLKELLPYSLWFSQWYPSAFRYLRVCFIEPAQYLFSQDWVGIAYQG